MSDTAVAECPECHHFYGRIECYCDTGCACNINNYSLCVLRLHNARLRSVVRAYLRSPDRGQEERLRVKARRVLKETEP